MKVQTQTEEVRRLRRTNLELIFSDHNAYCLPPCQNKCPSHIDIPGFLKAERRGQLARVARGSSSGRSRSRPSSAASARRRARSTAGATRWTRRSPSATRTATPATRSSRRCSTRASTRRSRSSSQARTGRRAAVIGSGPAGMAAAYYLLIAGHDVTVFERDPAPGGMLRYGIPQYRLPKVEVLEAEYESVTRLGGKIVCNAGLGRDFTLDDLKNQGFDAVVVAIGCYDTNKLGIPGEDADEVLDGLEYLRTATLGLPYPDHAGKRVVVIGGGFTSMDCSRTSVRQGAERGHARLPPRHEGHAGGRRGPRGDRGRRHGHLPGRPDAGRHRRGRQRHRRRVHPDAARARPTRPAGAARSRRPGTEFIDPVRPRAAGDRPGPGPRLDRRPAPRARGHQAAPPQGRRGDVRDRPARRLRHRRRPRSARRRWSRPSPRAAAPPTPSTPILKGLDLAAIRTRQTLAEPQPEFLSIVPFTSEVKEPRYRLKAMEAEVRNQSYIEYELPYTPRGGRRRVDALPAVHVRGDRVLRPAPPRHRVRDDAARRSSRSTTRAPATGPSPRTGSPGINHDYIRDDSPRVHPARAVALHRLRPLRPGLLRGRRRRLLRLHADRLRHARDDAARHEPQRHAVRVLRSLRRDVPDRRAHAEAARPRRSTRSTRAAASCAASASTPARTTRCATAPRSSSPTRAATSR